MKIMGNDKTLFELFVIKAYQRPYSWEKEQREDYWNDLEDMSDGEPDQHFFSER